MLIICVRLRLHLIEDNVSLLCIFVATTLLLHQHSCCSHWGLHRQPLPWKETKIFSKCFVSSSLDRYLGNFDRKLNKKRQVQFYNGNVAPLKFLINIIKSSWTVECWPFPPCWPDDHPHLAVHVAPQYSPLLVTNEFNSSILSAHYGAENIFLPAHHLINHLLLPHQTARREPALDSPVEGSHLSSS